MDGSAALGQAYVRHAVEQMVAVAEQLGDELVNERPVGPSTNSVAALVVHSCAVVEYWLGHVVLRRPTHRDRDAEFSATASVDELRRLVEVTLAQADADLERIEAGGTDHSSSRRATLVDGVGSDGSVVLHVLEELYQHLGQMEITADVLLAR